MRGGVATLGVDENARKRELTGVEMRMALVVGSRGGIVGAIVWFCLGGEVGFICVRIFGSQPVWARSCRWKLFRSDGAGSTLFFSLLDRQQEGLEHHYSSHHQHYFDEIRGYTRQYGPKTETSRAKAPAQDRFYHIQAGQ